MNNTTDRVFFYLVNKLPAAYGSSASNQLYTPGTSIVLLPSRKLLSKFEGKEENVLTAAAAYQRGFLLKDH